MTKQPIEKQSGKCSAHGTGLHVHGVTSGPLLWISMGVTLLFVLIEAIVGTYAHSLALLSDAGHNLSDAVALALAAYAVLIAKKPADAKKTFGYHRVAILSALFNSVTLILIAFAIFAQAYKLFLHPEKSNGALMFWTAGIALLMNTVIAYFLSEKAKDSLNIRAAFIHMAGDALSSLAVLVAGVVVLKTSWLYADPIVSTMIGLFIFYTSGGIVKESIHVLSEGAPRNLDLNKMVSTILELEDVLAVHDLHTWTVSDGMNYLSCHIVICRDCSLSESGLILKSVNQLLAEDFGIAHATIQMELEGDCESAGSHDPLFCGDVKPKL